MKLKLLTVLSGLVLTITGISCLARQGVAFSAVAFVLGMAMLLHGILSIVSCLTEKKRGGVSGYVLADGTGSVLLSAVVLGNLLVTEPVVPVFFGMWLLFSGVMHSLQTLSIRNSGEPFWGLGLCFGILSVITGMTCFIHAVVANMAVVLLVGIYFVMQGLSVTAVGLHFQRKKTVAKEKIK